MRLAGGGLDDEIDGAALDYEAIGSQAGIARVRAHAVAFAVSEMPLAKADFRRYALLQLPLVTGAVAARAARPCACRPRCSPTSSSAAS